MSEAAGEEDHHDDPDSSLEGAGKSLCEPLLIHEIIKEDGREPSTEGQIGCHFNHAASHQNI